MVTAVNFTAVFLLCAGSGALGQAPSRDDSCRYANDDECDEPQYCATGTDCSDCGNCVTNMYTYLGDTHCGGDSIDTLEDGIPYGWYPGRTGVSACEDECTASRSCTAFVWRDSDGSCFWKSGTTATVNDAMPGHDCYALTGSSQGGYTFLSESHCGGNNINTLEDGTPYGWTPPGGITGVGACEDKCSTSQSCRAFVWRDSDVSCFWKSGTTEANVDDMADHDCYIKNEYTALVGSHCGGVNIDALEDGTTYGWAPGSLGVGECERKCSQSYSCMAFVWRNADASCFWKSGTSAATLNDMPGHICYSKISGAMSGHR